MAYLTDEFGNRLVDELGNYLTDDESTPLPSPSDGRRYNYVVFNMCLALLAALPLLASNFMKWPLK